MTPLPPRMIAAGLSGLLLSAGVAACGVDNEEAGKSAPPARTQATVQSGPTVLRQLQRQRAQEAAARRAALPKPVSGQVTVVSGSALGITGSLRAGLRSKSNVAVTLRDTSDRSGFAALCDGRADIVESSRLMSQAEIDRCTKNGLRLFADSSGRLRPIQLAAEGIVVATKNESDLGGDCLKRSTVRQIFRAGSPITNWSQVGFDDVPLTTTGRPENTQVFNLFGNLVLGANGDATRADVRADYKVRQTDAGVRQEVTGSVRMQRAVAAAKKEYDRALAKVKNQRARARKRAADAASRALNRTIDAENRELARKKTRLSEAQAKALVERNKQRNTDARRAAAIKADAAIVNRVRTEITTKLRATLAQVAGPGTVGYFRFTYYELFENALRPIEIWDPVVSQATYEGRGIATNRTHARAEIQTDAVQRAGEATVTRKQIYTETPVTAGRTYIASNGQRVTVPTGGPIDVDRTPNCIFPSRRTISSGVYPLSVRLLAYTTTRALQRREVRDYFAYYLTDGQATVANRRLIPLDDAVRLDEYEALTGRQAPVQQVVNNTSVTASDEAATATTTTPAPGSATVPDDNTPTTAAGSTTATTPDAETPGSPTQTQTTGIPGVGG